MIFQNGVHWRQFKTWKNHKICQFWQKMKKNLPYTHFLGCMYLPEKPIVSTRYVTTLHPVVPILNCFTTRRKMMNNKKWIIWHGRTIETRHYAVATAGGAQCGKFTKYCLVFWPFFQIFFELGFFDIIALCRGLQITINII